MDSGRRTPGAGGGEASKLSYATYVTERLSGVGGEGPLRHRVRGVTGGDRALDAELVLDFFTLPEVEQSMEALGRRSA